MLRSADLNSFSSFIVSLERMPHATSLPNPMQVTLSCLATEVPVLIAGMVLH
jgi:hypothetical protein